MEMRKLSTMQRLVCGLLVIVSLLLLMFGTCVRFGSWSSIADDIDSLISTVQFYGSWMGLNINTDGVRNVNRAMSDGKLGAKETFTIAWEAGKLIEQALKVDKDTDLIKLKNYCLLYDAIYIATLVLAAAAAIGYFAGKPRSFPILYSVMVFVLFLFFLCLKNEASVTAIPLLAFFVAIMAPSFRLMTNRRPVRPGKNPTGNLHAETDVDFDFDADGDIGDGKAKEPAAGVGTMEGIRDRLITSTKDGSKAVKEQLVNVKDQLGQKLSRKSAQAGYCAACGCRSDSDARYCEHCGNPI